MDPYSGLYGSSRPPSPIQPFSPMEERSSLQRLAGNVLPGVVWAGQALDKTLGARGLRGLLAGRPRELLSVLPFSDTTGLTDPHDVTHGQDLLRQYGLIHGEDDDWQNVLAGIGTEIALNPATYLTFGGSALTDAGQLASKLGVLPKTMLGRIQGLSSLTPEATAMAGRLGIDVADVLNKPIPNLPVGVTGYIKNPLGGIAGLGLPFQAPSSVLGTGPGAEAFAGAAGKAANWLKYSMAGRYGSALFDPTVEGLTSAPFQQAMRGRVPQMAEQAAMGRGDVADIVQNLNRAGGVPHPNDFRAVLEGVAQGTPAETAAASKASNMLVDQLSNEQRALLPTAPLQDRFGLDYFPRQSVEAERELARGAPRVLQTRHGAMEARDPLLRDVPRGTSALEDIAADPVVNQYRVASPQAAMQRIFESHLSGPGIQTDMARMGQLAARQGIAQGMPGALSPMEAAELADLQFLWKKAVELEPWAAKQSGQLYRDPMQDLLTRTEHSVQSVGNANTIRGVITQQAVPTGMASGRVVPLSEVVKLSGFADDPQTYATIAQDLIQAGKLPPGATDLSGLVVPEAIARDAQALGGIARGLADSVSTPLRTIDSATSMFRGFSTALFPGFFGKKLASGIFRSLAAGSNPAEFAWATKAMQLVRNGEVVPGLASRVPAFAGMTDAEATAALGNLGFAHKAFGLSAAGMPELPGAGMDSISAQIPGEIVRPSLGDIAQNVVRGRTDAAGNSIDTALQRLNPLNTRGVGGIGGLDLRNVDQFAPMVAGRQAASYVDDITRGSTFLERLMQGSSPASAADFTNSTHFVGSDLSPFESSVMRRLVPFYGYLRHKVPWALENIAENPGGLQAMGIRAGQDIGEQNRLNIPPTLGGGLAAPVPGAVEGKQAYLTRLGLPFDEMLSLIGTGPDAIEHTGMKLGGQLNPLVKFPLEMATGRQFQTEASGSDRFGVSDQDFLSRLMMNSPLARFVSSGQTLAKVAEGEKSPLLAAINLLTGAKTSEVRPEQERQAVERDVIQRLLQNDPAIRRFEEFYVPPEKIPFLTPQEIELLRLQKSAEMRAQAAARMRGR